ncbi:MAG: bifunctional adenosylcobinamide kinase/adenosylcobinamide-phosphate guanylyltransferase [Deltaproteobacteria bacterium]|nr:MAG: bifunctional adenosylcobinamide kinase/adenosylcobinamide-phosphate guanylyltransferase [Deltaproteobacteria bacterium]
MGFKILLVIGGSRSGKSTFSQKVAESVGERRLFVATAEPLDAEMRRRIEEHKKRRKGWDTVEEPLEIAKIIEEKARRYQVILVDCLTLWLSNLLGRCAAEAERYMDGFIGACKAATTPLILVSNEVGMGIVPDNPLARRFGDLAGSLNQRIGEIADVVVMMIAGLPLIVKGDAKALFNIGG